MIAVRHFLKHHQEREADADERSEECLAIKRSLLLPGDDADRVNLLREVFLEKSPDGDRFRDRLRESLRDAIVELFGVYRETPGNASVELLLLNYYHIIQWLCASLRTVGTAVARRKEDYDKFFSCLLCAYFTDVKNAIEEESINHDKGLCAASAAIRKWIKSFASASGTDNAPSEIAGVGITDIASALAAYSDSPFSRSLRERRAAARGDGSATADLSIEMLELRDLRSYLHGFREYFLNADSETRLADHMESLIPDDPLRSGDPQSSFVWVCPDFADSSDSLPRIHQQTSGRRGPVANQWGRLSIIMKPYQEFYRRLEVVTLRPVSTGIH